MDGHRDHQGEKLNVTLQEEWLTEVMKYLCSLGFNSNSLLSFVYEQWLYTNLKTSTKPLLSLSADNRSKRMMLEGNTVVQVNSIVDISTSMYSQYRNLTNKFEDNSGFQLKLEESETNSDPFQNAKRMLSMEVTDGQLSMKAVEYSTLSALSLLTCPGCKILLTNNVCIRRGILLLTELNCIVLGGDDELLMKSGRPVEIMMKHLNINVPLQRQSFITLTSAQKEINHNNIPNANSVLSQPNIKPIMQVKPLSGKKSSSETPKRKMISANETARIEQSVNNIRQQINVSLNGSPSSSGGKTSFTASALKRSEDPLLHGALAKRIKIELADDDSDIILLETPTTIKQEVSKKDNPRKTNLTGTPKSADDPVIAAYKRLGVESIAAALRSMRYAVGPRRKILAALMETKPLEPLHVNNDGLWALTVALSDESYECLTCLVSHKFLVELIGWTPEEALDARASKDPARRKEGTLRTRSAGQSMRRLDLVWEVEFFPPGGSTPIIHKIDTYAQKFGLIR
uniref:RecQ-mediated genome instability protein 1 n=1 Tax=Wuchereria bancrofti TaxID=6293 RepID=A0A1I8EU15_WUCBA